jgi:hypothetical protein
VVLEGVAQPSSGPPLHVHHREDEAFYVVEGKFLFEYADIRVEGGPATYVFLPRDIPHCFQKTVSLYLPDADNPRVGWIDRRFDRMASYFRELKTSGHLERCPL